MPDQLTRQQKEQRSHQMAQVTEESRKSFLQSQVGMVESVLFETEKLDGMQHGYTKNYTPVSYTHLDVYKRQDSCRRKDV